MSFSKDRLNKVILGTRRNADRRVAGYRERALKLYPSVCGRRARTFTHTNLLLEIHHKNGNHDDNLPGRQQLGTVMHLLP